MKVLIVNGKKKRKKRPNMYTTMHENAFVFQSWRSDRCVTPNMYTTMHENASVFQSWRSDRCVTPTFDVNRRSLPALTFRSDLLWVGHV